MKPDFYPEKREYTCESYNKNGGWCADLEGPYWCPFAGDASKCTFGEGMNAELHQTGEILLSHEEKGKIEKLMNTAEMWLEAQKSGKTYHFEAMRYSVQNGLTQESRGPVDMATIGDFDEFMRRPWRSGISKSEAEKLLGTIIID